MGRTPMSDRALQADDLLPRLPLPLAQLYRRAHNAKTPRDAHDFAFYLWEAALKLLAAGAAATYRPDDPPDPKIAAIAAGHSIQDERPAGNQRQRLRCRIAGSGTLGI